jgi:hypothetical protein
MIRTVLKKKMSLELFVKWMLLYELLCVIQQHVEGTIWLRCSIWLLATIGFTTYVVCLINQTLDVTLTILPPRMVLFMFANVSSFLLTMQLLSCCKPVFYTAL